MYKLFLVFFSCCFALNQKFLITNFNLWIKQINLNECGRFFLFFYFFLEELKLNSLICRSARSTWCNLPLASVSGAERKRLNQYSHVESAMASPPCKSHHTSFARLLPRSYLCGSSTIMSVEYMPHSRPWLHECRINRPRSINVNQCSVYQKYSFIISDTESAPNVLGNYIHYNAFKKCI